MGILDDLREEASHKQSNQHNDLLAQEKLEHNYQQVVLPKMQQLYSYLKELLDYLDIVKTPITIAQYSEHYPQLGELFQQDYRLNTDKHGGIAKFDKITEVNLRFTCLGQKNDEFTHIVKHKFESDQEKKFLSEHKIPFSCDRNLGTNSDDAITFRIKKKIPVFFKFSVDYEKSRIILEIRNHENFEIRTQFIDPVQIDEHYLDKLARYILRKDNDFLRIDIDDSYKDKIRENIKIQKQIHADELLAASLREQKEAETNSVKDKITSFFKR